MDTTINGKDPKAYPHYRRNFGAVLADYTLFGVAIAFASPNTILPAFVRQLTDSPFLIGLNSTIQTAAWLFPQLVAANYLGGKAQKKRYILIPAAIGRPAFFVLVLALLLGAARYPALILSLLFVGMALFWATDALAAVAWFDVVAKSFPSKRRGRLFGLGQVLSGLLTVGAGLSGDAKINHDAFVTLGGKVFELLDENCWLELKPQLLLQKLIVDGLLGTGLKSAVRGLYAEIITAINEFPGPVLALDIPSGLVNNCLDTCPVTDQGGNSQVTCPQNSERIFPQRDGIYACFAQFFRPA